MVKHALNLHLVSKIITGRIPTPHPTRPKKCNAGEFYRILPDSPLAATPLGLLLVYMVLSPVYIFNYSLVKRLFSSEVTNIERDLSNKISILDAEVKPVVVAAGIAVNAHEEVKLVLAFLNHCV
jgi:hypothetical protein